MNRAETALSCSKLLNKRRLAKHPKGNLRLEVKSGGRVLAVSAITPRTRIKRSASAYAIPFAPRTFDLATANMVVENVDDPARMLDEIRGVLRPCGRFAFHTHGPRNVRPNPPGRI